MAKKLSSALGVDIGSQTIKVAEIRMQAGRPTVTAMAQAMTPEGAVDHIGIHDGEAVSVVLKQLCGGAGTSVNDVVVSVAGQGSVLVRTLEVPNMTDAELGQHMDWEITRNIPFAEKTVQSDFKAFPPADAAAQNMDVVMAISPQSAVDTLTMMTKKAGKKMAAIDVEPLGLARSLQMGYDNEYRDKTICLVEIGHKTTSINVYKNGQLLLPRHVPLGGEMFTQQIADALSVPFDEAERMKVEKAEIPAGAQSQGLGRMEPDVGTQSFEPYNPFGEAETEDEADESAPNAPIPAETGQADEGDDAMFKAMAGVLDELVAEVRRSIDYYRSKGGDIDVLMLCGGGSKLKGLAGFLEGAVGVSTEMYDPMKGLTRSMKVHSDSVDEAHMEEFAVAVGNGLYVCF